MPIKEGAIQTVCMNELSLTNLFSKRCYTTINILITANTCLTRKLWSLDLSLESTHLNIIRSLLILFSINLDWRFWVSFQYELVLVHVQHLFGDVEMRYGYNFAEQKDLSLTKLKKNTWFKSS